MRYSLLAFALLVSFVAFGQLPESNLIFRLDYDESYTINYGETSSYDYQGGFLTPDRYGVSDNACGFEADKQNIVFDSFPCLEREITISLWLKFGSFQGDRYPIIKLTNRDDFVYGESSYFGFDVHNNKTALGYYTEVGGKLIYDDDSLTYDNEWHHLVGTISDLNLMKFYIDNQYIGFKEFDTGSLEDIDQILIGGGYDGLFGHISVDDIRIYNRSLERCEIESLFMEKDGEVDCDFVEELVCSSVVQTIDFDNVNSIVYPNPNSGGELNVKTNRDASYQIFNLTGEEILSGIVTEGPIDIGGFARGMYFVKVNNQTHKILVQ